MTFYGPTYTDGEEHRRCLATVFQLCNGGQLTSVPDVPAVVCTLLFVAATPIATLECFACSNVTTVAECKTTVICNTGEICYTDYLQSGNGTLYSFGCRLEATCKTIVHSTRNGTSGVAGSLVGRSMSLSPHCSQCCKEHHCNRQLCQQSFSEKECFDKSIDCYTFEQLANICVDTQRANSVCRRTCGLCSYVDGHWAAWSTWSTCDVTCGDGHQTRSRPCTEPAPSGGGLTCQGNSDDSQTCTLQPCPVHGHWAEWSPWGSCSATCGIGMQRRDRTCSNPYPEKFGDHCFGDSRDDTLCVVAMCPVTNGGWGSWISWTNCTASCNGGLQSRQRQCNNPKPSADGDFCEGSSSVVRMCNQQHCPVTDGGWGSWTSWTSCTASCNVGMQSRIRHCNSPTPSVGGDFCDGSSSDTQLCNKQHCPRHKAAFFAASASRQSNGIIRFSHVQLNEGSVYNSATGEFTCPFPGLYVFIATMIEDGRDTNFIYCYIGMNGSYYIKMLSRQGKIEGKYATDGFGTATGVATLHLVKGDRVAVYCESNTGTSLSDSSFSGFLVSVDP